MSKQESNVLAVLLLCVTFIIYILISEEYDCSGKSNEVNSFIDRCYNKHYTNRIQCLNEAKEIFCSIKQ